MLFICNYSQLWPNIHNPWGRKTATRPQIIPPCSRFRRPCRHFYVVKSSAVTMCSISYLLPCLLSGTIHHVVPQGNKNGPGRMASCLLCDILSHKRAMIHLIHDILWINTEPETSDLHPHNIYNVHIYWAVSRHWIKQWDSFNVILTLRSADVTAADVFMTKGRDVMDR